MCIVIKAGKSDFTGDNACESQGVWPQRRRQQQREANISCLNSFYKNKHNIIIILVIILIITITIYMISFSMCAYSAFAVLMSVWLTVWHVPIAGRSAPAAAAAVPAPVERS